MRKEWDTEEEYGFIIIGQFFMSIFPIFYIYFKMIYVLFISFIFIPF